MLLVALELMQIVPNNFPFFGGCLGVPAGPFKQSHAHRTKAYINRAGGNCFFVLKMEKPDNFHFLLFLRMLIPELVFFLPSEQRGLQKVTIKTWIV